MKTALLSYSGWVMCLWLWTCCCLDSTFDSTRLTQDCNLRHSGSWRQRGRLSNKTNSLSVHSVHTYCRLRDRLSHALSHKSGPMPKVKEAPPPCYNRGRRSHFAPYSMIVYHNVAAPYPVPFRKLSQNNPVLFFSVVNCERGSILFEIPYLSISDESCWCQCFTEQSPQQ